MQGIFAEGKEHALAIGHTKLSSEDMYVCRRSLQSLLVCDTAHVANVITSISCSRKVNKGIGMDNMHYLNDGLWLYTAPGNAAAEKKPKD